MLAAVAGCMIGLLALDVRYNVANVVAVFHPLEHMAVFAGWANPQLANGSPLDVAHLEFLAQAAAGVLARVTFVLHPSTRPAIFVQWFVIVATVIAIRQRKWRLVLPVAGADAVGLGDRYVGHGPRLEAGIFQLHRPAGHHRRGAAARQSPGRCGTIAGPTRPASLLIAVHAVMSQMEPVKRLIRHDQPEVICDFYAYAARVEKFPTCPKPSQ